ncbi:MAG: DUF2269 family protein [Acidimicrobiia bacterium]
MTADSCSPTRTLSRFTRRTVLTAHVIVSVGLLGDTAGFLAVAVRSATTEDPELAGAGWEVLQMFSVVFGIPLSLAALITGLVLGWGSRWGVFRYPWVTTKLLLIVSVMLVGTFVLPGLEEMRRGAAGTEARLIAGAAYDVLALSVATTLAVFKPGGRWRRRGREAS